MTLSKFIPLVSAAAIACFALSSCATTPNRKGGIGMRAYNSYDVPATLPTNPSNVRVKVSTNNQMVYVYEGAKILMVTPVSVGTSSTPTPKGNFRIFKKDHNHRANSHGFAYNGNQIKKTYLNKKPSGWSFKGTPMPYWCEFTANYGFHAGWMKHKPCTHGCIRMHVNVAPKFFRLVKQGTPVNIAYSQPEDATIGRNVKRPIDAGPLPDYPKADMLKNNVFTMHKTPTYN